MKCLKLLEGKYKPNSRIESNLYLWVIKWVFFRLIKKYPLMKNKIIAFFGIVLMVVAVSSCATSKRYGCPTVSKIELKNNKA